MPNAALAEVMECIESGQFDGFKAALGKLGSPNVLSEDADEWPPLSLAVEMQGSTKFVDALLEAKADPNFADGIGCTPLDMAIRNGNVPAVERLIKARADIERKVGDETPLMMALSSAKAVDVARLLLEAGARVTAMNGNGQTALEVLKARKVPDFDLETLLQEHSGGTRAGSLSKLSPEEAAVVAVRNELCTYTSTKDTFVAQKWWNCETCAPKGGMLGACASCAKNCHKGHRLVAQAFAPFYCDCGSEAKACKVLVPKPVGPQGADAAGLAKYRELLGMALFDGEISEKEKELLDKARADLGVTFDQHEAALSSFSLTADKYLRIHVARAAPPVAAAAGASSSAAAAAAGGALVGYANDPDRMEISGKEALIVGNSAYTEAGAALTNPRNDAAALSAALRELGFNVRVALDVKDYDSFLELVTDFGARLAKYQDAGDTGCVGVFCYAGHAVELKGSNYLLHCGYTNDDMAKQGFTDRDALSDTLEGYMSSQFVMQTMEANCNTNVLILDCCRNNPFKPPVQPKKLKTAGRNSKAGGGAKDAKSGGLAALYPTGSTMIVLAAAPGFTAADGSDDNKNNGMFTNSLLKHLKRTDLHIDEVVFQASKDVYLISDQKQHPWKHSALLKHVYLGAPIVTKAP